MRRTAELGLLVLLAGCHQAAPVVARAGTIEITHPYAFAPVVGDEGSAYFTMKNSGQTADTLTSVAAGKAMAMLHASRETAGVVRMVMLDALPLGPGEQVALAVGQIHLMLTGLDPIPHPGDTLHLTLNFAHGGSAEVAVPVYRYGDSPEQ